MAVFRNLCVLCFVIFISCNSDNNGREEEENEGGQSGAGLAMEAWSQARFSENPDLNFNHLVNEFTNNKQALRRPDQAKWLGLGPKNIGGRTLCLAFHPTEKNVIFAGSASGGLWKTTTEGKGYNAWSQVAIGLPVYSVASIAISKSNPNTIFIGTGEVYNKAQSVPGIVDRTTRGTYGMGILKSTDGGQSWKSSLSLTDGLITGVQEMKFDPLDDHIIYAATTGGLYKSTNQGTSWTLILDLDMVVDVDINPKNPEIIYVTVGSFYDEQISGIYRSHNSGISFAKLKNGLPESYSGKAKLDIYKGNPDIIYASIADAFKTIGLYYSIDAGNTWDRMTGKDVADVQGWYSHDIAIHPTESKYIAYVGQNAYISDNQGIYFINVTSWDAGEMNRIPVGGAEGPKEYVHADIHAAYFRPDNPDEIFLATDGGIFVSTDKGMGFSGRNGSYQTTQFYANFSASKKSNFAIGGMQDNGTAIFDGSDAWIKVIGGDGMSTAMHPTDENIIYGSFQYFGLYKSKNQGASFDFIRPNNNAFLNETKAFNTPFEIIPSSPQSIFAGSQKLYLNESNGDPDRWKATHKDPIDAGSTILTIGVSPSDPSTVWVSTSPLNFTGKPKVFRSENGGNIWTQVKNLPEKAAMDIAIDPYNRLIVYVVFSGFGAGTHVFKSIDGGNTWKNIEIGLPDVPVNCIAIDPNKSNEIYLGNDFGVYFSRNSGVSWDRFMNGLPDAVMAMSLSISPITNKIKVATHGNGVYESELALSIPSKDLRNPDISNLTVYPVPATDHLYADLDLKQVASFIMTIQDINGKKIKELPLQKVLAGISHLEIDISTLVSGNYILSMNGKIGQAQSGFSINRKFVKK